MFKAVLWDFGGVITSSPFESFNRFEAANNLPRDIIRSINATNGDVNAWAQLESGQVTVDEFDGLFAAEAAEFGHDIRGKRVLELLAGELRPNMVNALKRIKEKLPVGCITNNVKAGQGPGMARNEEGARAVREVMGLFDLVVESSEVGIRKPDPRIYEMACEAMGIKPAQAVYLDDLGINLKPARALGMTTIKVTAPEQALDELEGHLGFPLR